MRQVTWPRLTSAVASDPEVEARIDKLLARMTLEEKVGQLIQPELRHVTPDDVRDYHLGSVLNGGGSFPGGDQRARVSDWLAAADAYYHASVDTRGGRTAIPIMWGTDAVHGLGNVTGATLFPHNIGLGATHNPALIRRIGEVTAREISVTGLDWNFSPTVAVARDERWGRAYEAYSEDPEIVRLYAAEMVRGLQGDPEQESFLKDWHVVATAKHFIGDGGTVDGIDRGDNRDDEERLRDIHAQGYFSAIEAGVQVVMASFNSWHGELMHGHKYLLTDVLKERLGFDGVVIGDWSGHGFLPGCTPQDCPDALMAGLDIYMIPDENWKDLHHNLVDQVTRGVVTTERFEDAVRRVLRVKLRAGMFESVAPSARVLGKSPELLGAAEHRAVARQAVRESLVMLKNRDQLLPLSPAQRVLVAGDGADSIGKQCGGWSLTWQGIGTRNEDFPGATSIYQGIAETVTAAGGQVQLSPAGDYEQRPDVAIVVFGEDPYAEAQGDMPNTLYKPGDESDLALLRKLRADGIPVVALFITGRPLWVNREINASDAFVVVWQPGTEGAGVAEVLFTDAEGQVREPVQGRLTFTWPKRPDQGPINRGDADYDPLFPYGYGLRFGEVDRLDELPEEGMAAHQSSDVLDIFYRRAIAPWQLEVEGARNDRAAMTGSQVSVSSLSVQAVDREMQEDVRRVTWNGEGFGKLTLAAPGRQDLRDYLQANAALVFDLCVQQAPTKPVQLRVASAAFCYAEVDLTPSLGALTVGQWHTFEVDLAQLPDATSNFGMALTPDDLLQRVMEPFTLVTEGELQLTFGHVRLEKGAGKGELLHQRR
ncbi:glycoside hydrolase family 3 protein [Marinimicrobium alkaliphilum]|uniref:glycoside hydrolase family 3 protein n=1 Tax=Marinimicrobium alkaliphilum TaxID=2202654 RepID=UPI000DBA512A|nr:glycoside hydrolase family 3 N-terminal domain-containing protein [Marinimicrobium alkaliphilum]